MAYATSNVIERINRVDQLAYLVVLSIRLVSLVTLSASAVMPHLSPRPRRTTVDAHASARLSSSHLGPVFGSTKNGRRTKGEDDNITQLGIREVFYAMGSPRVRIRANWLHSKPPRGLAGSVCVGSANKATFMSTRIVSAESEARYQSRVFSPQSFGGENKIPPTCKKSVPARYNQTRCAVAGRNTQKV
ncbi:hypothetical protein BDV93DRAFT_514777 [Ceratobasidium sp. AG-I]|nr:hypothetical protein BDV93DRAFT_514777 [Ceratobasidium sp. AG-I]